MDSPQARPLKPMSSQYHKLESRLQAWLLCRRSHKSDGKSVPPREWYCLDAWPRETGGFSGLLHGDCWCVDHKCKKAWP